MSETVDPLRERAEKLARRLLDSECSHHSPVKAMGECEDCIKALIFAFAQGERAAETLRLEMLVGDVYKTYGGTAWEALLAIQRSARGSRSPEAPSRRPRMPPERL